MLDTNIKTQLKAYLEKLQAPIELVASLDDSPKAIEIRELLDDIAGITRLAAASSDKTRVEEGKRAGEGVAGARRVDDALDGNGRHVRAQGPDRSEQHGAGGLAHGDSTGSGSSDADSGGSSESAPRQR